MRNLPKKKLEERGVPPLLIETSRPWPFVSFYSLLSYMQSLIKILWGMYNFKFIWKMLKWSIDHDTFIYLFLCEVRPW